MRQFRLFVVLGLAAAGLATTWAGAPPACAQEKGMSLLSTLAEWKYPESKMLGGASMSDGGNPQVQSVVCRAILTTTDPIETVADYYEKRFGISRAPSAQDAKPEVKEVDAKTAFTQDDSEGRPVKVRIIVVNKVETSTTLVITRADGENETHIAWSHYRRFRDNR